MFNAMTWLAEMLIYGLRVQIYAHQSILQGNPTKAYCKEMRADVDGLRFKPDEARARLVAELEKEDVGFG